MGKWLEPFFQQRPWLAVIGWFGLFVLLTGAVIIAPAFVSLAVGALTAGAWCRWLETSHGIGAENGTVNGRDAARHLTDSRGRASAEELAAGAQSHLAT